MGLSVNCQVLVRIRKSKAENLIALTFTIMNSQHSCHKKQFQLEQ